MHWSGGNKNYKVSAPSVPRIPQPNSSLRNSSIDSTFFICEKLKELCKESHHQKMYLFSKGNSKRLVKRRRSVGSPKKFELIFSRNCGGNNGHNNTIITSSTCFEKYIILVRNTFLTLFFLTVTTLASRFG